MYGIGDHWDSGDAYVEFEFASCNNFVYARNTTAVSGSNTVKAIMVVRYDEEADQPIKTKLIYDRSLGDYDSPVETSDYSGTPAFISYDTVLSMTDIERDGKGMIAVGSHIDPNGNYHIYLMSFSMMDKIYDVNISGKGANIVIRALPDGIKWASSNAYGKIYYDKFDNYIVAETVDVNTETSGPVVLSKDGQKALYKDGIYFDADNKFLPLIVTSTNDMPIAFTDYIYYTNDQKRLLTSNTQRTFELEYAIDGDYSVPADFKWCQLSDFYFAVGNNLYISEYRENGNEFFAWYFPKYNVHEFDSKILNLLPISATEVAIFLKDSLWYVSKTDSAYTVNKSKLELNVTDGFDVISSPDGTLTMFCTDRGFVALSYQDFIASTEQSLTFLSDVIYDKIKEFVKNPVKLFKHDFWITLYQEGGKDGFIFDMRNNSWWPVSWNRLVDKVSNTNTGIMILSDGKQYHVDRDVYSYYDYDGGKSIIDWSITSQKLHLSAINNYKHLSNITFTSMLDASDTDEPVTYNMDILNYRKFIDIGGDTKIVSYKVDILRTYVQRLNYPKVNEFQYTLSTDHENTKQLPLSLSSITLKYKITGQVR